MNRLGLILWVVVFLTPGLSEAFAQDLIFRYEKRTRSSSYGVEVPLNLSSLTGRYAGASGYGYGADPVFHYGKRTRSSSYGVSVPIPLGAMRRSYGYAPSYGSPYGSPYASRPYSGGYGG